jgi:hypothetical protein
MKFIPASNSASWASKHRKWRTFSERSGIGRLSYGIRGTTREPTSPSSHGKSVNHVLAKGYRNGRNWAPSFPVGKFGVRSHDPDERRAKFHHASKFRHAAFAFCEAACTLRAVACALRDASSACRVAACACHDAAFAYRETAWACQRVAFARREVAFTCLRAAFACRPAACVRTDPAFVFWKAAFAFREAVRSDCEGAFPFRRAVFPGRKKISILSDALHPLCEPSGAF